MGSNSDLPHNESGDDFISLVPVEFRDEYEWEFGQVVHVVLLALPVVAFIGKDLTPLQSTLQGVNIYIYISS